MQKRGPSDLKAFWKNLDEEYFKELNIEEAQVSVEELIDTIAHPIEGEEKYLRKNKLVNKCLHQMTI